MSTSPHLPRSHFASDDEDEIEPKSSAAPDDANVFTLRAHTPSPDLTPTPSLTAASLPPTQQSEVLLTTNPEDPHAVPNATYQSPFRCVIEPPITVDLDLAPIEPPDPAAGNKEENSWAMAWAEEWHGLTYTFLGDVVLNLLTVLRSSLPSIVCQDAPYSTNTTGGLPVYARLHKRSRLMHPRLSSPSVFRCSTTYLTVSRLSTSWIRPHQVQHRIEILLRGDTQSFIPTRG